MKISKWALAFGVASLLFGGQAIAQGRGGSSRAAHGTPARQVDVDYDSYYQQDAGAAPAPPEAESPSDAPAAAADDAEPAATAAKIEDDSAVDCDDCRPKCKSCDPCCGPMADPYKLFDSCLLDRMGTYIGGFVAQSFTWNPDNPRDRFNGPVTFTDRANEYQLNQAYMYAGRDVDTGGSGTDLGGRIDALYGTDHRFTTATGLETNGNGTPKWNSHRFYGLALPQFYGEVGYNDLKVKVGHFYSPVGYFVVPTNQNFFSRLPYTFQYGEPFTHTGLLGTYQMTDKLSVGAGIIRGWDNFDTGNPHAGYLGTMTYQGPNGGTLSFVQVFSRELSQTGAFNNRYLQTLVWIRPLNNRLTHVIHTDFGYQNNALANGRDARWYGINSYLFYKVNNCWTWGLNTEWFRDDAGFRVGGFLPTTNGGALRGLSTARSGYDGTFYQVTFGPNWRPRANPNLLVRSSCSFDWYNGPNNAAGLRPYDDGANRSQVIWATDLIVTF